MPHILPEHEGLIEKVLVIERDGEPPVEVAGSADDIDFLVEILKGYRERHPEEAKAIFGPGFVTDIPTHSEIVNDAGDTIRDMYDPCTYPSPTLMGIKLGQEESDAEPA